MHNSNIKEANRKALPKFLLILLISLVIGGTIGYCSAKFGFNELTGSFKRVASGFSTYVAPWMMLETAILVPTVCLPIYRSAKKLLQTWDGEDEALSETVDNKISIVVWITSCAMICSFFLMAATYSNGFATFEQRSSTILFTVGIAAFFAILIESILLQQKCVDTAKVTNPEKTVSIYDTKFHKKWMDSCDEAEKLIVGKCAFQAYSATNGVCCALSILLTIGALLFEIGFLPCLVVCLVWIVNLSAYCKEGLKCSKAGSRIS